MSGVIDLNCEGYYVTGGSIGHSRAGYVFRCTIGPVSDELSGSLVAAVRLGSTIRLLFPQPLLLERVEIERIDEACIRIVGRVMNGPTRNGSGWSGQ